MTEDTILMALVAVLRAQITAYDREERDRYVATAIELTAELKKLRRKAMDLGGC